MHTHLKISTPIRLSTHDRRSLQRLAIALVMLAPALPLTAAVPAPAVANPAAGRQLVLQAKLRDVTPRYLEFERTYAKFKELAPPQLQREAADLKRTMGAMERAASNKTPQAKPIQMTRRLRA